MSAYTRMAAAVAFGLAGVLGAGEVAAQVKIGAVLSVTGPASFLGDPEKKTLEMYVDEINAKGGVNGKKIELVVYDDGGDANKARTFATRLVEEDKVVAMVGGITTGATMAMIPVFEEAQMPFISLAGAVADHRAGAANGCSRRRTPTRWPARRSSRTSRRATSPRSRMISGTDGFGKSMRDQCVKVAPKVRHRASLHEETYGPRDSDMTPQLTNIKGKAGVQAVVNPGFGQGPAIVTRNYTPARHHAAALPEPRRRLEAVHRSRRTRRRRRAAAGRGAAGRRQAARQRSAEAGRRRTTSRPTRRRPSQPVSTFGGHAYDGLMILVEAMKRAGSFDKAKVRDEIEKTKGFIGTGGVVNMSPTDHLGLDLTAFRMLEIKNGDWTLVQ